MKEVCYQPSPFSHEQVRGDPCTNQVQICLKNGNQVATWKTSKSRILLERQKEQILAEVRCEIQKHEVEAESDRKKYPGINWNYWFSANGNWLYYYKMWAIKGEISYLLKKKYQNKTRDLRETRIRNMRDMEELQKSHVLKVEELSWRKLTEDLWGSNFSLPGLECQDSLHPWRQRREIPRCWDWQAHQEFADAEIDKHTPGIRWLSPLYLQEREASASKACFKVHNQF